MINSCTSSGVPRMISTYILPSHASGFQRLNPLAHKFLENIDDKIKEARKALITYLKDDSHYIDFHIEECGLEDLPTDITEFVTKMIVTNVGLWIDSEKPHITMDFMIAPDESDEILCVKFGEDAKIISIDWES